MKKTLKDENYPDQLLQMEWRDPTRSSRSVQRRDLLHLDPKFLSYHPQCPKLTEVPRVPPNDWPGRVMTEDDEYDHVLHELI